MINTPLVMDWLILLLLVPAIVVPIVLLWGFAGCSFQGQGDDPPAFPNLAFQISLTSDEPGFEDRCVVQRIKKERFADALTGLRKGVSITVRGPEVGSLTIKALYIGQPAFSGDPSNLPNPWDSQGAGSVGHLPGEIKKLVDIAANDPPVVLPWRAQNGNFIGFRVLQDSDYIFDPSQDLLISFDIIPAPGQGRVRRVDLAGAEYYYREHSHEAAEPDKSSDFTTVTGSHVLVEKIEVGPTFP